MGKMPMLRLFLRSGAVLRKFVAQFVRSEIGRFAFKAVVETRQHFSGIDCLRTRLEAQIDFQRIEDHVSVGNFQSGFETIGQIDEHGVLVDWRFAFDVVERIVENAVPFQEDFPRSLMRTGIAVPANDSSSHPFAEASPQARE